MPDGNTAIAILLMLALIVAGIVIELNLVPMLGLGFGNITSIASGIWIITVKIVGLALIIVPIWVIFNIFRESF